jgi:hypothetical protein
MMYGQDNLSVQILCLFLYYLLTSVITEVERWNVCFAIENVFNIVSVVVKIMLGTR